MSGYLGVSQKGKKWSARCNNYYIGLYPTAEEAAHQYDAYVYENYGKHSERNFPSELVPLIPKAAKSRKETLPVGVTRTRETNRYRAVLLSAGNLEDSYDTAEEASKVYQQAVKAKEDQDRLSLAALPIDYDKDGVPVVPIRNAGKIIAYTKCDPEDYFDLKRNGINMTADGYAQTRKNVGTTVLVHRWVIKAPPNVITDHINRDRIDNRRSNLRLATPSESLRNTKKRKRD